MSTIESLNVRPNQPPRQELEAIFSRCCEAISRCYPKDRTAPGVHPYAAAVLHEAAHALMAFDWGVGVNYIRLRPLQDGGTASINEVFTGKGVLHDSKIEAQIWLAGYCVSWIFKGVVGESEVRFRHDLWQALLCLERGEEAAHQLLRHYYRQVTKQCPESNEQMAEAMRAACAEMLQQAPPDFFRRIRAADEAKIVLRALVHETCEWVIDRLLVLEYLVYKLARRNKKSEGIETEKRLFKSAYTWARRQNSYIHHE